MKQILLLGAMLVLGVSAFAEDERPQPRRGGGDAKVGSERMLDRVRERDPGAFAELERLRKADPEAFRVKMREMYMGRARPDKVGGKGLRPDGGGAAFGTKGGRSDMRRGAGGNDFVKRLFERLAQFDPKKAEALKKLHTEDPEAFRVEVRKMLSGHRPMASGAHGKPGDDRRNSCGADREGMKALRDKYKKAGTTEEQAQVRNEIRAKLGELFDMELGHQEERLTMMANQIEAMRERLDGRRANRDELIRQQEVELLEKIK